MRGMNATDIADIIQAYVKNADQKALNRTFKRGIVTDVKPGNRADVSIEGNPVATVGILALDSYSPSEGDRVLVVSIGETGANLLIIGSINGAANGAWAQTSMANTATGKVMGGEGHLLYDKFETSDDDLYTFSGNGVKVEKEGRYSVWVWARSIDGLNRFTNAVSVNGVNTTSWQNYQTPENTGRTFFNHYVGRVSAGHIIRHLIATSGGNNRYAGTETKMIVERLAS